ncbi:MAG: NAD/NADP octopine/nopaline dehydrogenase family protein [Woeseiaceae bacterium]|nr:NAD/NADP octopine/nopaline dehydrogenase family protein [Woeseiaceae bacterium]
MKIAVLGAGAGGASAVAELTQNGHSTRLWNRSSATLQPFIDAGGVCYEGVLGKGKAVPELISDQLQDVLSGADGILVCLPTLAHASLAAALADIEANSLPVVLNPGHTGGVFAFRKVFAEKDVAPPPVAEFSTLTYVARKTEADSVSTTGAANHVWVAGLPGDEPAVGLARELYPAATPARDVLATGLANVNLVLHPPGAILGAAWVEATEGDFTFYVQGLSDGVARVMETLDAERVAVAAAFELEVPALFSEMQSIGTIEDAADAGAGLAAAVRSGTANQRIKAPSSLAHRYYVEDFFFGVRPFLVLAGIAGVEVPVAQSLMTLAETMVDKAGAIEGRSAAAMGIAGMNRTELLQMVRS